MITSTAEWKISERLNSLNPEEWEEFRKSIPLVSNPLVSSQAIAMAHGWTKEEFDDFSNQSWKVGRSWSCL